MKIYILPIEEKFQPSNQLFVYPKHNKDYGVEQDFLKFLNRNQDLLTNDPTAANWHYLPVFWTRWHLNHNYAKSGLSELQKCVDGTILDDKKTFTVCQYDDGPVVNTRKTILYLSSRKGKKGKDIPLLSSPHKTPLIKPKKRYLASFVGRLSTHSIRKEMKISVSGHPNYQVIDGNLGKRKYVNYLLSSYVALSPRGYGGNSFRFYEAMELGTVPFLIGARDTRPFKDVIDWAKISLYARNPKDIKEILEQYSTHELLKMGQVARNTYLEKLDFGKWCSYIIDQLS